MFDPDPFTENYLYSPLCKRDYTDIQPEEDVTAETNRLIIRSPEPSEPSIPSQSYPFKRFKQDDYSVNYLSTNTSSPLAHIDLQVTWLFCIYVYFLTLLLLGNIQLDEFPATTTKKTRRAGKTTTNTRYLYNRYHQFEPFCCYEHKYHLPLLFHHLFIFERTHSAYFTTPFFLFSAG